MLGLYKTKQNSGRPKTGFTDALPYLTQIGFDTALPACRMFMPIVPDTVISHSVWTYSLGERQGKFDACTFFASLH